MGVDPTERDAEIAAELSRAEGWPAGRAAAGGGLYAVAGDGAGSQQRGGLNFIVGMLLGLCLGGFSVFLWSPRQDGRLRLGLLVGFAINLYFSLTTHANGSAASAAASAAAARSSAAAAASNAARLHPSLRGGHNVTTIVA
eukprot:PLAT331.1.p2 GENE.PLAT331.1~~PLAT331.1.p2  ORF type:complete len:141 (+),score=56.61 PLAT331.1:414-836(+)